MNQTLKISLPHHCKDRISYPRLGQTKSTLWWLIYCKNNSALLQCNWSKQISFLGSTGWSRHIAWPRITFHLLINLLWPNSRAQKKKSDLRSSWGFHYHWIGIILQIFLCHHSIYRIIIIFLLSFHYQYQELLSNFRDKGLSQLAWRTGADR